MKLQRFTAPNSQKAMLKIQEILGPDALICSTRNISGGVEVLAGLPHAKDQIAAAKGFEIDLEELEVETNSFEKLTARLEAMNENIRRLSLHLDTKNFANSPIADDEHIIKKNMMFYHLSQLGFRSDFCHHFIKGYSLDNDIYSLIDEQDVYKALMQSIRVDQKEFIEERNVFALLGPTGVGKTTTITKLAKRYIARYGADSLGLITTDCNDIGAKNQLLYYSNLFNVELEYANSAHELAMALQALKKKNLILIDTYGVSQRDAKKVAKLLDLLQSSGEKVSSYLTLPCNVQEPILDDIARAFTTKNLRGCILTKQDECISIAPALSISIRHKLNIAYICNGQNIQGNLEKANAQRIFNELNAEQTDPQNEVMSENFIQNFEHVKQRLSYTQI